MLIERILEEAFQLIEEPGVRAARYVVRVAARGGCSSDRRSGSHSEGTGSAIAGNRSAQFYLYDRQGRPAVHYGGDHVHFDPGSSCLNILDPETRQARPALAADLVKMVEVAEMLPQFAAQSTAMLDNDVPPEIGDWYRLFAGLVAFGKARWSPVHSRHSSLHTPALRRMLHHGSHQGDGGSCARRRHADDLRRNSGSRQIDEVLRSKTDQFSGGDGQTSKIARGLFRGASRPPLSTASNAKGDFLKLKEIRARFRKEQPFPPSVIDRGPARDSTSGILDRARARVEELRAEYRQSGISAGRELAMLSFAEGEADRAGFEGLPGIHAPTSTSR
jgi:hypothetical protein